MSLKLWHYTNLNGLKGIISSQCLWATDYRYLNDSSELHHSQTLLSQVLLPRVFEITKARYDESQSVREIIDFHNGVEKFSEMATLDAVKHHYKSFFESPNITRIPCVLSFCKTQENERNGLLSQWRGYGKDGGCAVIFDEKELDKKFEKDEKHYYGIQGSRDVVYAPPIEDQEIKDSLVQVSNYIFQWFRKPRIQTPDEFLAFIKCMAFIKHNGFSEEHEYRYFSVPSLESERNLQGFKEIKDKKFRQIMFRETVRGLAPYIPLFERSKPLPIAGICIGPHNDREMRVKSIQNYLHINGYKNISVFCSEIPFVS